MGWVQVDDLSGEVIPTGQVRLLTLRLDDEDIAQWEVKVRDDLEELLADLAEHLVRWPGHGHDEEPVAAPRPAPVNGELVRALVHKELGAVAEQIVAGSASSEVENVEDLGVAAGQSADVSAGEARNGHATDATIRAWAAHHHVPASTTGGLKKWVKQAYQRVHGGAPDEQTWLDAGIDPATWTDADGRPRVRQGAAKPTPPQTPAPTSRGAEGDPATDPDPRPGSAPDPAPKTPETAGQHSEDPPTPDPSPPAGRAPAATNGRSRPEQVDLAHELAADGATPMTIVDRTGVSLEEARAIHEQARRERAAR